MKNTNRLSIKIGDGPRRERCWQAAPQQQWPHRLAVSVAKFAKKNVRQHDEDESEALKK